MRIRDSTTLTQRVFTVILSADRYEVRGLPAVFEDRVMRVHDWHRVYVHAEGYVSVPLQETYDRAFAALPRRWARVLEQ